MISQLRSRASQNKTLEDLISRMQLIGALLSRHPQAVCPAPKATACGRREPVRTAIEAGLVPGGRFDSSMDPRESMPPDLKGDNMSGDAHVN